MGHSRDLSGLSLLNIKAPRVGYVVLDQKKFEFKLKFVGGDTATVPGLSEKLHVSSTNKQNYSISSITLQRRNLCSGLVRCPPAVEERYQVPELLLMVEQMNFIVVVMSSDFSDLSMPDWIQEAHNDPYLITLLMA